MLIKNRPFLILYYYYDSSTFFCSCLDIRWKESNFIFPIASFIILLLLQNSLQCCVQLYKYEYKHQLDFISGKGGARKCACVCECDDWGDVNICWFFPARFYCRVPVQWRFPLAQPNSLDSTEDTVCVCVLVWVFSVVILGKLTVMSQRLYVWCF